MSNKQKAIIVDLDGTLCDVGHRVHHVEKVEKDWKQFNELMVHDSLNHWCFELMEALIDRGYKILFVTGRGEFWRGPTETWLLKHSVKYDLLFMRGILDRREDSDVKQDIYEQNIKDHYDILFVVDDRKSVVERWRKLELVCLQCAPGDF